VLSFVTGTLKSIKSDVDENLSLWYKENSQVYVGSDHACWQDPDLTRKVRKRRFGTVIKSTMPGLNKMMHEHADEVKRWMLSRVTSNGDTTEEDKIA
jgi:histone deacetylase 6